MKKRIITVTIFCFIILGVLTNTSNALSYLPGVSGLPGMSEIPGTLSGQGGEPADVDISSLDEKASAAQIYAAIRTYLESGSGIVENVLKPIIKNEFSGSLKLKKWSETLKAKIREDNKALGNAETEQDKVALQGSIDQHKEALNFIKEALGENAAGNEQSFMYGDEKWRTYVIANYKDRIVKGENRTENGPFKDVIDDIGVYTPTVTPVSNEVTGKVSEILTIITNVGMILAVIVPAVLGIKYMLGSVEEKVNYKNDMIPYIVGSVLLFGVCGIVKMTQLVGEIINKI